MRLPRYLTHKDSGIDWLGQLPSHWEVKPLKYACDVFPSNVDKKSYEDEVGVVLCNYTDVYYNERITSDFQFMAATATKEQIEKFSLRSGDVIITKDSETADDIAIAAYVPDDLPGVVCGYHLSMVRVKSDSDGLYIKRLFDSHYLKSKFAVLANGLTRVGLSQSALDNVTIPLPPFDEQLAIAAFLNRETAKIDTLISEQEQLITLLAEKRQATISHAVTKGLNPHAPMKDSGVAWLGEVPEHWTVTRLKYAMSHIVDCPHDTPVYNDDGLYQVIRTADISLGRFHAGSTYRVDESEYLNRIRRLRVVKNDIVYSREGERWGFAALVPEGGLYCLGQRMMQFRGREEISANFMMWQLNAVSTYRQGQMDTVGATAPHVNVGTIRNYRLTEPPLDEQIDIADFLADETEKLDALANQASRGIKLLIERRTALISAAVTGKIDVRQAVQHEPATIQEAA